MFETPHKGISIALVREISLYQFYKVPLFSALGDHKKRAKYHFAGRTLMRVLPDNIKNQVDDLIEKKTMKMDLYDILGQCTWGQLAKSL